MVLPLSLENIVMVERSSRNQNSILMYALELGMGIASLACGDISLILDF